MKKKYLLAIIPAVALILVGAQSASAYGWFAGNATPEEIALHQKTMFEHQATMLGISADAVKAGWAEGKTLEEIATANGISATDLQARMLAERKKHHQTMLQSLVSQGVITQAQADQRLAAMETRAAAGKGMGMMMGRGFGHGMR
jgi:hypothetical protein